MNKDKLAQFQVETDFIRHEIRCSTSVSIDKGKAQAQTSALLKMLDQTGVGASDYIYVKALYIRNKSVPTEITLSQLLNERESGEAYSILDKKYGDEVKFFEIRTKDLLGRKFVSPSGYIEKIEKIAKRFLEQVMSSVVKK